MSSSDICIQCNSAVRPRQEGLQCDGCNRWQHRKCGTGITQQQYREANRQQIDIQWSCTQCQEQNQTTDSTAVSANGNATFAIEHSFGTDLEKTNQARESFDIVEPFGVPPPVNEESMIEKKLSLMKKILLRKQKKLKKLDRLTSARQHVKKKLEEQALLNDCTSYTDCVQTNIADLSRKVSSLLHNNLCSKFPSILVKTEQERDSDLEQESLDSTSCGKNSAPLAAENQIQLHLQKLNSDNSKTLCDADKTPCDGGKTPCDADKMPCDASKTLCDADKTPCDGGKTPCDADKMPCDASKTLCDADKTPCDSGKTLCDADKTPCDAGKTSEELPIRHVPPDKYVSCEEYELQKTNFKNISKSNSTNIIDESQDKMNAVLVCDDFVHKEYLQTDKLMLCAVKCDSSENGKDIQTSHENCNSSEDMFISSFEQNPADTVHSSMSSESIEGCHINTEHEKAPEVCYSDKVESSHIQGRVSLKRKRKGKHKKSKLYQADIASKALIDLTHNDSLRSLSSVQSEDTDNLSCSTKNTTSFRGKSNKKFRTETSEYHAGSCDSVVSNEVVHKSDVISSNIKENEEPSEIQITESCLKISSKTYGDTYMTKEYSSPTLSTCDQTDLIHKSTCIGTHINKSSTNALGDKLDQELSVTDVNLRAVDKESIASQLSSESPHFECNFMQSEGGKTLSESVGSISEDSQISTPTRTSGSVKRKRRSRKWEYFFLEHRKSPRLSSTEEKKGNIIDDCTLVTPSFLQNDFSTQSRGVNENLSKSTNGTNFYVKKQRKKSTSALKLSSLFQFLIDDGIRDQNIKNFELPPQQFSHLLGDSSNTVLVEKSVHPSQNEIQPQKYEMSYDKECRSGVDGNVKRSCTNSDDVTVQSQRLASAFYASNGSNSINSEVDQASVHSSYRPCLQNPIYLQPPDREDYQTLQFDFSIRVAEAKRVIDVQFVRLRINEKAHQYLAVLCCSFLLLFKEDNNKHWKRVKHWTLHKFTAVSVKFISLESICLLLLCGEDEKDGSQMKILLYSPVEQKLQEIKFDQDYFIFDVTLPLCNGDFIMCGAVKTKRSINKLGLIENYTKVCLKQSIECVNDTVISLLAIEDLSSGLIGLSRTNVLYIWNHDNGILLSTVDLFHTWQYESSLSFAFVEKGYLAVQLFSESKDSVPGCLLAVNPQNRRVELLCQYGVTTEKWNGHAKSMTFDNTTMAVDKNNTLYSWDSFDGDLKIQYPGVRTFSVDNEMCLLSLIQDKCIHIYRSRSLSESSQRT